MNVITKDKIVINKETVTIKPINFEAICDLEDIGFDIRGIGKKTFSNLRCALAYNMDISPSEASEQIEKHIKGGGKLSDLAPLINAILESDFFNEMLKQEADSN